MSVPDDIIMISIVCGFLVAGLGLAAVGIMLIAWIKSGRNHTDKPAPRCGDSIGPFVIKCPDSRIGEKEMDLYERAKERSDDFPEFEKWFDEAFPPHGAFDNFWRGLARHCAWKAWREASKRAAQTKIQPDEP